MKKWNRPQIRFFLPLYSTLNFFLQKTRLKIKEIENSMSEHSRQNENENTDEGDDWSQDSLEYLYDNKIFLPGFVRSECPIWPSFWFFQISARSTIFHSDTALSANHRRPYRPHFRDSKCDSSVTSGGSHRMCKFSKFRWVPAGTLVPMGTGVPLAPTPGKNKIKDNNKK